MDWIESAHAVQRMRVRAHGFTRISAPIPRNRPDISCRLDRGAIFIPAGQRGRNTTSGAWSKRSEHHVRCVNLRCRMMMRCANTTRELR